MIKPQHFPFQFFPTRVIEAAERYHSNEELRNNPPEAQRIHEEPADETVLLTGVRISFL